MLIVVASREVRYGFHICHGFECGCCLCHGFLGVCLFIYTFVGRDSCGLGWFVVCGLWGGVLVFGLGCGLWFVV